MLTTHKLIQNLISLKAKYPGINSNALVIGNDINSAKAVADRFSRVIVVDNNIQPTDYKQINDFPNIVLIKSPLDFASRSFPPNFFGLVFISDPKSLDILRYLVNSISNTVQGIYIIPEDPDIDMSELDSIYDNELYIIRRT